MPHLMDRELAAVDRKLSMAAPSSKMIQLKTYLKPSPALYFGNRIMDRLGR